MIKMVIGKMDIRQIINDFIATEEAIRFVTSFLHIMTDVVLTSEKNLN